MWYTHTHTHSHTHRQWERHKSDPVHSIHTLTIVWHDTGSGHVPLASRAPRHHSSIIHSDRAPGAMARGAGREPLWAGRWAEPAVLTVSGIGNKVGVVFENVQHAALMSARTTANHTPMTRVRLGYNADRNRDIRRHRRLPDPLKGIGHNGTAHPCAEGFPVQTFFFSEKSTFQSLQSYKHKSFNIIPRICFFFP